MQEREPGSRLAVKFATKDSIFKKNFSLLRVGERGGNALLLLKEGQNVFKFYTSGRRHCQGLLAMVKLKCHQDLMARLYNLVVPCKGEISFEVYMNEEAMDHVVFALVGKKMAKGMQKEVGGGFFFRFGQFVSIELVLLFLGDCHAVQGG
ncbi:hypothetical protein Tsubulata_000473 [Turnera subulata]|uniref:Uncharacterized protein n=1 Tax=Turnera subulata TaxID=218843 RepID=A0A9Q0GIX1_9ROSI|nr:hypothetical protein Tsubulata_000473 [Turnera subulata]